MGKEISPWMGKGNPYIERLSPTFPVYTMRETGVEDGIWKNIKDNLCDSCFLNRGDRSEHFWYREKRLGRITLVEIDRIDFYAYMKMHFEEISGMNAFWDLGRLEFMTLWQECWRKEIQEYQAEHNLRVV